jgi:hypothetical protein
MTYSRFVNDTRALCRYVSSRMPRLALLALLALAATASACSSSSSAAHLQVPASPPPKDDGKAAQSARGSGGGEAHAAALEQLKVAPLQPATDKQGSVRFMLPDAPNWTRVKFWGLQSLVGFRYGKDHHAIVAAFVTHVADNGVAGACSSSFETWAQPWVEAFDVELSHEPPRAFVWNRSIADIDVLFAKTATLASRDSYAAAYGTYPVWKNACLVVGIAVPSHEDEARARDVRDRFAAEVLPKVQVTATLEPNERY